jgi:hypothetical protein
MPVGDVNSDERGSGARFNDGKPDLALIPLRVLAESFADKTHGTPEHAAVVALHCLGEWQEGGEESCLYAALRALGDCWAECAQVFEYGRRKYAAWNWAKGMAWSVPLACAARHIVWGILAGEHLDPESGKPHHGHVYCNIVMLLTYQRTFPEGDDRPKSVLSPP